MELPISETALDPLRGHMPKERLRMVEAALAWSPEARPSQ